LFGKVAFKQAMLFVGVLHYKAVKLFDGLYVVFVAGVFRYLGVSNFLEFPIHRNERLG
jgi:hypothetical protein